jgi:hypothetical protein
MKTQYKKIMFLAVLLCMNCVAFADIPDPDPDIDPPAAPIDSNAYDLVGVGLLFAFWMLKRRGDEKV